MDDRQSQVRVGAGLEESRINQEFLDWLGKWGPRILIVLLVIVAAYQGKRFLDQNARDAENQAYVNYHDAVSINDPAAVLGVGDDHEGVGTIWEMSRLRAAEILMTEGTSGLAFSTLDMRNPTPDEVLTDEVRTQRLERAAELYQDVIDRVEGDNDRVLFLLKALDARASAMISLERYDEGEDLLNRVMEVGDEAGFADVAALARERLARWESVVNPPVIVSNADVPGFVDPAADATGMQPVPLDFQELGRDQINATDLDVLRGLTEAEEPGVGTVPPIDQPNVPVRTIEPGEEPSEAPEEDAPATTEPADTPGEG